MFNRIKKQISDKKILRRYLGAKNDYRGFVAIVALLIISSLVALVVYSISISIQTKRQVSNNLLSSAQSYYMAESGMEDAVLRVLKNYSYTALNSFTLDGATVGQNITQTGNVLDIATDSNYSNNVRKLTSSLTITTSNISFHYGVQVGEGGL